MAVHLTKCNLKGCEKCCMSSAVDGTDGDMLWDVRSECEEVEGTGCECGDSNTDWYR
jgi:hypothetical protein